MAAEAPVNAGPIKDRSKGPILTTRNVTLVSYRLDETTSSEDTQAAILTDLYTRFRNTPMFKSYDELNKAIIMGEVAVGTFVLFSDFNEEVKIVVAKIRATGK